MKPNRATIAILALVGAFLATLVGMRMFALQDEHAAALGRAEAGMVNLARVADQYARRVFETSEMVGTQVTGRVAELGGVDALRDSLGIQHWLRDLSQGSAGDYLMVVDASGRPVASSHAFPAPRADLADRDWFLAHRDGADEHVGEAIFSRITDEVLFTYSRVLRRADGTFDGAVEVAVRTGFFQQPAFAAEFGGRTGVGLFDREGRVLARTGLVTAQLGMRLEATPLLAAAAAQPEGTLHLPLPFDGLERILAYRRLDRWGVLVTASVPVEDALAPWRQARRWSVQVLGAVALGLLLLAALAIRLARREAATRGELAAANEALRDAATELEARVAERTRELTESERRFRVTFDSTFQIMGLLDPEGRLLEANETALQLLGLPRQAVVGRALAELPCWPDQATRRRLAAAVADAAKGVPQREEMTARGADGRLSPLDVSLRPARDAEGRIAWLVVEGHDLADLKAAEARLRESQKLEALGQLTGGVAHDFNNLLMVVLGNLGLLRKRLPAEPRILRLLDGAQQGAERGAALTARMLAFARRQELRPAPADLAGLVRGLVPLLERSAGPKTRIETTLPEGLPPALVDANQLELALLNLVVNARDAMPGGGVVTIAVDAPEAPAADAPAGLLAGRYLRLTLADTGTGMDAATLARATEPFFTTKGVGRGSGLGLSMVQGLAQQSGGGLRLASSPAEGTTAAIWLPRAEAHKAPAPPPHTVAPDTSAPPPRRVMVVDDDPLVAAGTAMMLEDLGHSAVVAASADEALQRLAQEGAVDLVLTDYAMPGRTGLDLAEALHRDHPGLPVALATGYAEAAPVTEGWLPRLNKPYRQEELDALVRRLTGAPVA